MDTNTDAPTLSKNGLAYLQKGPKNSSTGLVLLHGWACQSTDFVPLINHLSSHELKCRAITVDFPGHGQSPVQPNPSIANFATAVLSLTHELKLDKVIIAGHSMGARVALECFKQNIALKSPSPRVCGLVFIDGSHYKFRSLLFAFDKSDDVKDSSTSAEQKAKMKAQAFESMFSSKTPEAFRTSTLAHLAEMDPSYAEGIRRSHLAYDREMMDDALREVAKHGLAVLNVQSTGIDSNNQRVSLEEGQRTEWMDFLQETVPQTKQIVISGAGHFPHVDRSAVVGKALIDFMSSLEL